MGLRKHSFTALIFAITYWQRRNIAAVKQRDPLKYGVTLSDGLGTLRWDVSQKRLLFELTLVERANTFGFGFSNRGETINADFVISWADELNRHHFQDAWVDLFGRTIPDAIQNYHYDSSLESDNHTVTRFWREVNTCDSYDYQIDTGTSHVLVFASTASIRSLADVIVAEHAVSVTRVQLLKSTVEVPLPEPNWKYFDVKAPAVVIPAEETTYWCTTVKLPLFARKNHIVKFEGIIDRRSDGIVHHMEAFHCQVSPTDAIPFFSGPCSSEGRPIQLKTCSKVIGAWAMGATAFAYPREAGVPIGGKDASRYVMLEIHYNNVAKKTGVVDASGIRFTYTPILRDFDAAILEVGVIYDSRLSIPPHQRNFRLEGVCSSQCTDQSLQQSGIKIFAAQLHTHLTGQKVKTMHIRDGIRLKDLNSDDHYSPHFQEIRLLPAPVEVFPGDALINVCEHDTTARANITLGGFAISDEMCVSYLHYYPKSSLEVCKSSISPSALDKFFSVLAYYMHDATAASNSVSANMRSITWSHISTKLLQWFYDTMPIEQACLLPDGTSHPGRWYQIKKPTPWFTLDDPEDECDEAEVSAAAPKGAH